VAFDQLEVELGQEVGRVIASNRRQYNANVGIKEHFVKIGHPVLSRIRDEAALIQRVASDFHFEAELANLRNASLKAMGVQGGTGPRRTDNPYLITASELGRSNRGSAHQVPSLRAVTW
jgi:hypothetical protein